MIFLTMLAGTACICFTALFIGAVYLAVKKEVRENE